MTTAVQCLPASFSFIQTATDAVCMTQILNTRVRRRSHRCPGNNPATQNRLGNIRGPQWKQGSNRRGKGGGGGEREIWVPCNIWPMRLPHEAHGDCRCFAILLRVYLDARLTPVMIAHRAATVCCPNPNSDQTSNWFIDAIPERWRLLYARAYH